MTTSKKVWQVTEITALYEQSFMDLLYQAHTIYQQYFPAKQMQLSTLLNIKNGGCPENCAYCPQSAHYQTGVKKEPLMPIEEIVAKAQLAKAQGATRFCMGAAWRDLPNKAMPKITAIIKEIKALGLEVCMTLGMLTKNQAKELKRFGLDFYNHNLDTSEEYYQKIITTRQYQERLTTLQHVDAAGIKICCGGIVGMGETRDDRIKLLIQLSKLPVSLQSVPINRLLPIPGTPLEKVSSLDNFEFIRTVAVARIVLPKAFIRLSAGRINMSEEMQAWCFFAGVNSIHYGEKLLITPNCDANEDHILLEKLGIKAVTGAMHAQ